MPQAKRRSSTSKLPPQLSGKKPIGTVSVPSKYATENTYAVIADGDCLGDLIRHGETIVASADFPVAAGMLGFSALETGGARL